MLVERVLEAGREVDLGRLDRREAVEQLVGQGRRAVLDRAGRAERAGDRAELAEDVEVELDLGHAATGQRHATVRRAGLDADLAHARGARGARVELAAVARPCTPRSSSTVEFWWPTSPISPPTLIVTPSVSSERM